MGLLLQPESMAMLMTTLITVIKYCFTIMTILVVLDFCKGKKITAKKRGSERGALKILLILQLLLLILKVAPQITRQYRPSRSSHSYPFAA